MLGTREILRPLISGTRGLNFLKTALIKQYFEVFSNKIKVTLMIGNSTVDIRRILSLFLDIGQICSDMITYTLRDLPYFSAR